MSAAEVVELHAEQDPSLEMEGLRAALETAQAQARKYRDALEAVRDLATDTAAALPNAAVVKMNVALGALTLLSGLAETALEG